MSDLKAAKDGRSVVAEHLTAFNEHDTDRLLAGFASDAVWATGQLVVRGRAGLVELFGEELWKLGPSLTVLSLVSDRRVVAAELREELTVDERQLRFNIAVFFYVSGGLIHQAKVYREGTADID